MTVSGEPKDYTQAKHINKMMKNKLLKGKGLKSIGEVIAASVLAVVFHNNRRPYMSLGMMTLTEASESTQIRKVHYQR